MSTQKSQKVVWTGQSGKEYDYWVHPIEEVFTKVPANYIFAKLVDRYWHAVYIGETGELGDRLANHHKVDCVERRGATHIHVHGSSDDATVRRAEEKDLTDAYNPPCNG
ncbi:MAG: hypothetical protein OD918_10075 [Gammaproteobacteria bacterium]